MHGVGDPFVKKAFEVLGFPPYIPVKEQQFPDAEFPTVKYPNPEEKGSSFPHMCGYCGHETSNRSTRMLLPWLMYTPHSYATRTLHCGPRTMKAPIMFLHKTQTRTDFPPLRNGELSIVAFS